MLVYVIIPVYNAIHYLEQTVHSVLSQPYPNISIILVDDGSTDGSSVLCDQLAEQQERISAIHQNNQGVSAARNAGIEYALQAASKVDYLAFLDSDDLWCPNCITHQLIGKIQDSAADIVGFSMYGSNPDATMLKILSTYQEQMVRYSEKYQTDHLWAKGSFGAHLYHVRLFRENGIRFVVDCRQNEDVIFASKMFFCSRVLLFTNQFLYIYRRNRRSVTSTNRWKPDTAAHVPDAWYEASSHFTNNTTIPAEKREAWSNFCMDISAARCLEMIHELATNGYPYAAIDSCFTDKPYYLCLSNLEVCRLAEWQQPDLKCYQADPKRFCRNLQLKGLIRRPLRRLLESTGLLSLIDKRYYKIHIDTLMNN